MLKKRIRDLIVLLSIVPALLLAQTNNFEFIQYDLDTIHSEDFVVLHGDIFNLIDNDYDLSVTRVTHYIPAAWSTSFCVGPACLPPFLDTFTFTLA
ncbi:MAG: hypothetical protein L3J79_02260, partial [Candidatus Marinimicrobia bacterium]|nr:hypothetical protein [Candidatus Neomarinimicrobiota bacterium]